MKKHICSLFICFLCAVVCLGFLSACGDDDAENFSLVYEMSEPGMTFELQVNSPDSCSITETSFDGENKNEYTQIFTIDSSFGGSENTVEKRILDLKRKIKKSGFMKLPQDKPSEAHPSDGKVRTLLVELNGKECSFTVSGDDAPEPFLRAETAIHDFLKEIGE